VRQERPEASGKTEREGDAVKGDGEVGGAGGEWDNRAPGGEGKGKVSGRTQSTQCGPFGIRILRRYGGQPRGRDR
jgi:hypothetical protein